VLFVNGLVEKVTRAC